AAFAVGAGATAIVTVMFATIATDWPAQHRGVNAAELRLIAEGESPLTSNSAVSTHWEDFGRLLANRSLVLLTLSYAAVGYFQYLFFYWSQQYFDKVLEV